MTTEFIMDCSAVLAILFGESGQDRAAAALKDARISTVNLAEVVTKLIERGATPSDVEGRLSTLALNIADFDGDLAIQAGLLRTATRHKGLSLGDRACLALAIREGLPVMTTDRAWSDLDLPVEVVLIR